MKTMTIAALFAAMSLMPSLAVAQPAETTGTEQRAQRPGGARGEGRPGGEGRQGEGRMGGSPVDKLRMAQTLDSISAEQKGKISEFMEARKPQFDGMREEMRTAMQAARENSDRDARRKAMEPLRQKHEALRTEVDTFLKGVLTADQQQELETKAKDMTERGRERMGGRRGPDDASTTGARQGRRAGRDGQRWNREKPGSDANATTQDAATTGAAAANPFAGDNS